MNALHRIILFVAGTALTTSMLTGCTHTATTDSIDTLDNITESIERADYASAVSLLDQSRDKVLTSDDARLMVRYSILYMKLADACDSVDMVGCAYQCMYKAYVTDSTTTADFINTLPPEDLSQAAAVKTLLGASGMKVFHDDSEYPDSLFIDNTDL